MATFRANPNAQLDEPWLEHAAFFGFNFRIWHVIFFCFAAALSFVILICCCVKLRIPRTKQEVDADYQRKQLAVKFRQRLRLIRNQDMDTMDLEKALRIIQEDYKTAPIY